MNDNPKATRRTSRGHMTGANITNMKTESQNAIDRDNQDGEEVDCRRI